MAIKMQVMTMGKCSNDDDSLDEDKEECDDDDDDYDDFYDHNKNEKN